VTVAQNQLTPRPQTSGAIPQQPQPQPQAQAQVQQPPIQPQPQQTQPPLQVAPVDVAALNEQQERMNLMSIRVGSIRTSIGNLARDMARDGHSPDSGITGSEQRMIYQMEQAESSLKQNNAAEAKRRLDGAERELERLEKRFNK
jgi:hypothetical protein